MAHSALVGNLVEDRYLQVDCVTLWLATPLHGGRTAEFVAAGMPLELKG